MMIPLIMLVMSSLITFIEATAISSSLAIIPSEGGALVCAIVLRNTTRSIECSKTNAVVREPFPICPNISFASITGGGTSLCGLQYDDTAFFCWRQTGGFNYTNFVSSRLYKNVTAPLRELAVGEKNIAATDKSGASIRLWSHTGNFLTKFSGNFSSLTSGNNFICAIDPSNVVDCWGPDGPTIKVAFTNERMAVIVAGNFRACGVTMKGKLLCNGKDLEQPKFEFRSLALGSDDTCVLRSNDSVVCWGARGEYSPAEGLSFLFLVANDHLFCGLTIDDFTVHCWWTNQSLPQSFKVPLQMVVPGICSSETSCNCKFLKTSKEYCPDNFVICKPCSYPSRRSSWSEERTEWLVLGCVGFLGVVLGIWSHWYHIISCFAGTQVAE